ncbi:MAG: penicillin acylase family protein [Myxococcota bacterium]
MHPSRSFFLLCATLSISSSLLLSACGAPDDPLTPSLTPEASPSSTVEPTPIQTPTATPIQTPSATPQATATPTATPTPTPAPPLLDDQLPNAPVEILIDDAGIAHLYAQTDEDLFFAAGYQLAVDRLYQMEMLRRFAFGRLAEVLGEEALQSDLEARTFDFPRWGALDMSATEAADPERVQLLRAWVRGINRRVDEIQLGDVPLPFGFRPEDRDFLPEYWRDEDPYIVLKGAGFALDLTLSFEYAVSLIYSLYPEPMAAVELLRPAHETYSLPPEERPTSGNASRVGDARERVARERDAREREAGSKAPLPFQGLLSTFRRASGSNNWAVEGRFTSTGYPLLAGDPHLSFDFFGAPYPLHLNSADAEGSFNVIGFAYPGTPGIAIGHNERVSWTPTSAFADVMDIWALETRRDEANLGGVWKPILTREEEIVVRAEGAPVGVGRVVRQTYEEIDGYGMIVPAEVLGLPTLKPLLCQWTGFTGRPARWFMELNRVASRDELDQAIERMREMNYNFIGADAEGIALKVGVEVPRRQDVTGERTPWKTLDGSDPLSLWTEERLTFDETPSSRGGSRGWLVTANNDPYGFTGDGRIDNDPWFYGAFFDPGYRAHRAEQQLSAWVARGGITLEDMQQLQLDTHSTLADDLIPILLDAWGLAQEDPQLEVYAQNPALGQLITLLEGWDRRMDPESPEALIFQDWLHRVTDATLRDDIPTAYDFAMALQTIYVLKVAALALQGVYPDSEAVLQEGREVIVLDSAAQTAAWLEERFGAVSPPSYTYGTLKHTNFDDAFGLGMPLFTRPSPGGEDSICVSQNIAYDETASRWDSTYVSVERMISTFTAEGVPEAWVNYPVGPAADPASTDTLQANADYLAGRYSRLRFKRAEIEATLRTSEVLTRRAP